MKQTCFSMVALPDIVDINELAVSLCNLQQAFDKCPAYLTKKDYLDLLNTLDAALFHLYKENKSISLFNVANLNTNPIYDKQSFGLEYPGVYILTQPGQYVNFYDTNGQNINVNSEELLDAIIFAIPQFVLNEHVFNFAGYSKIVYQLNVTVDGGEIGQ